MTIKLHGRRVKSLRLCQVDRRGIALLAVLWLVAAMSIMLAGLQHVVHGEIRIASQTRTNVSSAALADAAIRLTLQALDVDKTRSIKSIQTKVISVLGADVKVDVIPLNGYIDLNNAPLSLLVDVFRYAGEVSDQEAQRLAVAALEARSAKGADGMPVRFHAIEDLLRIEGFDYKVYARLKNYVTVDTVGSGRVNPLAASMGVLVVLAKGDHLRAQQLFEARLSSPESMDTTTLTAAHLEIAPTNSLLFRAAIAAQDSTILVRTWRVNLSASSYGLPWRVLGVDQITAEEVR